MDLMPAETTTTGVRPNSIRSADMSNEFSPSRCTPPLPPVTNVEIPAMCAKRMVDATVVAPHWAGLVVVVCVACCCAKKSGISRVEHLTTRFSVRAWDKSRISSILNPT
eukprot:scaffold6754_cov148-Amphora_coffeaeformis.AAC.5